jgi:hypothetical protein
MLKGALRIVPQGANQADSVAISLLGATPGGAEANQARGQESERGRFRNRPTVVTEDADVVQTPRLIQRA